MYKDKESCMIEYLKRVNPEGLFVYMYHIDWDLVERFAEHWQKTGEDHSVEFFDLLLDLSQLRKPIAKQFAISKVKVISGLLNNRYIFTKEDVREYEYEEGSLNRLIAAVRKHFI